jgi:hypothetical protein
MSEFSKDLELDVVLASGTSTSGLQRTTSSHFDQRRQVNGSGVVVDTANSKKYTSDGFFNLSDYYPITVNGTGILQVNIRDQINVKQVVVLDASGEFVSFAKASKLSHRNNSTTQQRITSSGSYYMYIELEGRSSAEYRIGVDVYNQ